MQWSNYGSGFYDNHTRICDETLPTWRTQRTVHLQEGYYTVVAYRQGGSETDSAGGSVN
ncbi:hypothetical protein Mal4_01530 [Maioricimonas rarisocia]|uniref:Uncharacterized protein n=1 Tax=Maioricimonas rarisocia TaxID=2528026 RepID=A0A517Z062_9PLAN|nr:hypothetical protein Mal4_01530 [Maioricimonas rarisocia]